MGTPQFAVPTLKALVENKFIPKLVITQPDKEKGRGRKKSFSQVKEIAIEHNLRILQPEKINTNSIRKKIQDINPDIIITAAYGKILGRKILAIPRLGCINLHPSLLPKYRGPSPINWALFKGEKLTGNTVYFMNEQMDAGDIILQKKIPILPTENYGSLITKMSEEGANDVLKAISLIDTEYVRKISQDHSKASYTKLLDNNICRIDWTKSALEINNLIRGLAPYPAAFSELEGMKIKILTAQVIDAKKFNPGEIINVKKNIGFTVSTGSKSLLITEIKPQGKRKMTAYSYSLGHALIGKKFDNAK